MLHAEAARTLPKLGIYVSPDEYSNSGDVLGQVGSWGIDSLRVFSLNEGARLAPYAATHGMDLYLATHVSAFDLMNTSKLHIDLAAMDQISSSKVAIHALCLGHELGVPVESDTKHARFPDSYEKTMVKVFNIFRSRFMIVKERIRRRNIRWPLTHAFTAGEIWALVDDMPWSKSLASLVESLDLVSVTIYPHADWKGHLGLKSNHTFLSDRNYRLELIDRFEEEFSRLCDCLTGLGKPIVISETGLSSCIGWKGSRKNGMPIHGDDLYVEAFSDWMDALGRICRNYSGMRSVYLFEWKDNPEHPLVRGSGLYIHAGFGLAEKNGHPKISRKSFLEIANRYRKWKLRTPGKPKHSTNVPLWR